MKFIVKVTLFRVPVYPFLLYIFSIFVVYLLYHIRLIRLSGAIVPNPDPEPSFQYFNLSVFNWNLNNITSHDCLEIKLLTMYNVTHTFDITCIVEHTLTQKLCQVIII